MEDEREAVYDVSTGATFNDLEWPLPLNARSTLNISETVKDETLLGLQWNTNRDLHTPYSRVSFRMTLSDLENIQWHEASRGLSASCLQAPDWSADEV